MHQRVHKSAAARPDLRKGRRLALGLEAATLTMERVVMEQTAVTARLHGAMQWWVRCWQAIVREAKNG